MLLNFPLRSAPFPSEQAKRVRISLSESQTTESEWTKKPKRKYSINFIRGIFPTLQKETDWDCRWYRKSSGFTGAASRSKASLTAEVPLPYLFRNKCFQSFSLLPVRGVCIFSVYFTHSL